MLKKFSAEWYRARVLRVIAKSESSYQNNREVLDLVDDRRLKAIDNEFVAQCTKLNEAWLKASGNRERHQAYISATKTLSHSPWRTLWHFIETLPLTRMFELARKNDEVRKLFLARLQDVDNETRKQILTSNQAIKRVIDSLSNDIPPRPSLPGKAKISNTPDLDIPHPMQYILKESTKGGGLLGAEKLGKHLEKYCTKHLSAYLKWNQRREKTSASIRSDHVGKLNVIGVLTALFTPRKAQIRLQQAIEEIESGTDKPHALTISIREIENFLSKKRVTHYLKRLS